LGIEETSFHLLFECPFRAILVGSSGSSGAIDEGHEASGGDDKGGEN